MSDVAIAEATSNTDAKTNAPSTPAPAAAPVAAATPVAAVADTKVEPANPAAPKVIAFKDPKTGEPLKGKLVEEFTAISTEQGWEQDVADTNLGRLSKALTESRKAMEAEWDAQLKADKVLGGEKLAENLGAINEAITKIAGADYLSELERTGLAKHPPTLRAWHAVSKAISADKFTAGVAVPGRPGQIADPKDTSGAAFASKYATAPKG